jgi:hypothetical protein
MKSQRYVARLVGGAPQTVGADVSRILARERASHGKVRSVLTHRIRLLTALSIALTICPGYAQSPPGAIFTTNSSGTVVNGNVYQLSSDVYISGGPQNHEHFGPPDGEYFFQVTDPSGAVVLSSDNAICRQVLVANGVVSGSKGACRHASGKFDPANTSTPVQLAPFAPSPNSGNEYKVWLIAQTPSTTISNTDPKVINFARADSKTDNFKVQSAAVPPPAISSCRSTSSLSALVQPPNVTAYVPNGAWASGAPGVRVVAIEPASAPPLSVPTPAVVNSCATNWTTGQVVCTANNNDVYLITGSTLQSTLSSGATASASFSGGRCRNCGVAINSVTNTAVIAMGVAGSPSGDGIQFLNLSNNTFAPPVSSVHPVSEDILWDPGRSLILSPDESGFYDIFRTSSSPVPEFGNSVGGILDSAAEDCTTGIALSTDEFTNKVYISDLSQATLIPGSPAGTWTAPGQFVSFPEFSGFAAGTSGVAVAPGAHLAIVAGEFGGNQIGVLELPASSGTGTPNFVDYAAALLPPTPDGNSWLNGLDPHTVTAYISPNDGKAYALLANIPVATWLAVVDLQGLLTAPRIPGTHSVEPSFNLVGNGIVRYVSTH